MQNSDPFPLRPLWLLEHPSMQEEAFRDIIHRLGFNALVSEAPCKGFQWIQKAQTLEQVRKSQADFIFWESGWQNPEFFYRPDAEDFTRCELIQQELQGVESSLKKGARLIFYVPGLGCAQWLDEISYKASKFTSVAFSSVSGELTQDHLGMHPFWNLHRTVSMCPKAPFLPIVNVGMTNQGSGLWPTLPFEIFESVFCKIIKHRFAGFMSVAPRLPKPNNFGHCALSVAGAFLQSPFERAEILIEDWFQRYQPVLDYARHAALMKSMRFMGLEVFCWRDKIRLKMTAEENKCFKDSVAGRLSYFNHALGKEASGWRVFYEQFAEAMHRLSSN